MILSRVTTHTQTITVDQSHSVTSKSQVTAEKASSNALIPFGLPGKQLGTANEADSSLLETQEALLRTCQKLESTIGLLQKQKILDEQAYIENLDFLETEIKNMEEEKLRCEERIIRKKAHLTTLQEIQTEIQAQYQITLVSCNKLEEEKVALKKELAELQCVLAICSENLAKQVMTNASQGLLLNTVNRLVNYMKEGIVLGGDMANFAAFLLAIGVSAQEFANESETSINKIAEYYIKSKLFDENDKMAALELAKLHYDQCRGKDGKIN